MMNDAGFERVGRRSLVLAAMAGALLLTTGAYAQNLTLSLGIQESGTAQWEIETIKSLGLDTKHGLDLQLRPVADSKAGQIALQSGAVDVILSDFVWVSIQRNQGNMVTLVPHSLAVGGVMVDPASGIDSVDDLKGKTIAIGGGPVDKSWIILQAYYTSKTGGKLVDEVKAEYGAPPLVNELLSKGEAAASLNFWQWNARAKAAGKVEVLSVKQMLADLGVAEQPPLLGWAFMDTTAEARTDTLKAFLDASFEAKEILRTDDAAWEKLKELMGAADDENLFKMLRDDYRAGIVTTYDPANVSAAQASFELMAKYGGAELVGDVPTLAEGTFWKGYSK